PEPTPIAPVAEAEKPAAVPARVPSPPAVDSDVLPPMPSFKEPPPEKEDDYSPLPMPRFAEPPSEAEDTLPSPRARLPSPLSAEPTASNVSVTVAPPTPSRRSGSGSSSPARSRSPSVTINNPVSHGERKGSNLSRSGSSETSRLRGPRGARARQSSGSVASAGSSLSRSGATSPNSPSGIARANNRMSYQGPRNGSPPVNPQDYEPRKKGARTQAGNFSQSAASLSRRTVASDAEDEVVGK
ncbi:hypothetical protein EW145_g4917, partial [Phellinidium pouzarii]